MTNDDYDRLIALFGTKASRSMVEAARSHLVDGVSQNQAAAINGVDVGALNRFVQIRRNQAKRLSAH